MSREIKFRAWSRHENKWRALLTTDNCLDMTEWAEVNGYTLMQYTGLKDKNGKELYEGDVVKCDDGSTARVVFEEGSFKTTQADATGLADTLTTFLAGWDELEVIGNVYESPELLGAKS